jgi:hypothetical protein
MVHKIIDIVIIGGGKSIQEGISLGLETYLEHKCVILTNYAYKYFKGTFLTFIDRNFYKSTNLEKNPDIYIELSTLPLIIGCRSNPDLDKVIHPNTIMIPCPKQELLNDCHLTGLFALAIAEKLEPKNIFLLGFDWDMRPIEQIDRKNYKGETNLDIHYYKKEIPHRGLGYVGFYENHNPNNYFKYFNNSKSKIYNVSLNSNINNFEKISYQKFFELLSHQTYNQEELRQEIRNTLH